MLHRAGQIFSATLDSNQVLTTVLETTYKLLKIDSVAIWLIDPMTKELVCNQASGIGSETVQGWRLAPGQGIAGWTVSHNESILVSDTHTNEYHSKGVDQKRGFELRSMLSVPLRFKDGVIGVIQAANKQVNQFTLSDQTLLELLAGSAAIAIENARLYEECNQAVERLWQQAHHDNLTGLPNRAMLINHLERVVQLAKYDSAYLFAVLFLDLNRFKLINDSFGHLVGDLLLIEVARRLERCIRKGDIVARLGGDEFTILLENIKDMAEAMQVADRINAELSCQIILKGQAVSITASIGITTSLKRYEQVEDLLRDADSAMYEAKSNGRGRA